VQDPAGRLHLLWPRIGARTPTLEYATSDDGRTWQRASFTIDQLPQSVHAAVGADHLGVAVWNTPSGGTPSVYALAIGPSAAPQPVLGRTVAVAPVRGTVRIKPSKGRRFVPLREARTVPVGSQVDVRRGTVRLVSATNAAGATQSGEFTAGIFQALQGRKARGLTELRLKGGSPSRCGKVRAASSRRRLSRRVLRRLRANARGRFRTSGRYASATVRGTAWDITDRCDGTLVRVRRGVVVVRDVHRRRSIIVRAGKSYLARARR
jgi:hypothetical protein